MKRYVLLLACFSLLLYSCSVDKRDVSSEILSIDKESEIRDLKMSDLYSGLEYVRLETNSESLISQVYKIIPFSDKLLLIDRELGKIFVYSGDGEFLSTIGNKGEGPEEFSEISDVTVDRFGQRIFVLDNLRRQVLVYNFDGTYNERISTDFTVHEMEFLKNDVLVFYCDYSVNERFVRDGQRPNVLIMDLKSKNLLPDVYVSNEIGFGEVSSPFSSLSCMTDGRSVLFDVLTNRLFFIGNEGVESMLSIDFNEQEKIDGYVKLLQKERLSAADIRPGASKSQPYTMIVSCLPTQNYCLLNAMDYSTMEIFQIAYSMDNGKSLYGKGNRKIPVVNDMDGFPLFTPYSSVDDNVYGIIEPYMLLDSESTSADVKMFIEGLREDDNPIVVIAKTKKL